MKYYVVSYGVCGYLPNAEPEYYDTKEQAIAAVKALRQQYIREWNTPVHWIKGRATEGGYTVHMPGNQLDEYIEWMELEDES